MKSEIVSHQPKAKAPVRFWKNKYNDSIWIECADSTTCLYQGDSCISAGTDIIYPVDVHNWPEKEWEQITGELTIKFTI